MNASDDVWGEKNHPGKVKSCLLATASLAGVKLNKLMARQPENNKIITAQRLALSITSILNPPSSILFTEKEWRQTATISTTPLQIRTIPATVLHKVIGADQGKAPIHILRLE